MGDAPSVVNQPPDEETRQFDQSVNAHLAMPEISLFQHRRAKVAALEKFLAARKIVYLDTKYWIYLREPDASPDPEVSMEIKRLLYAGVAAGRLICPMSYATYSELQAMPRDRRLETAKVMDDLSQGYCLSGPDNVYGIEITRFFIENLASLRRFTYAIVPVWTRVGTLFGEMYPPRMFPEHFETAVDKAVLDRLWNLTVTQMAQMREQPLQVESAADEINMERRRYPRNGQSFHELYSNELHGLLDFNKPIIDSSVRDVAALTLPPGDIPTTAFSDQFPAHVFVNLLRHATTLQRGQLGLAMQRTEAALYAILRLDEQRPFKPNDANDIRHTAAALAYCDAYLTERFFATLTNRREIRKVAPLHCQVAWNASDALSLIQAISRE